MLSAPSNAFASGEMRIIITNKEKADAEISEQSDLDIKFALASWNLDFKIKYIWSKDNSTWIT